MIPKVGTLTGLLLPFFFKDHLKAEAVCVFVCIYYWKSSGHHPHLPGHWIGSSQVPTYIVSPDNFFYPNPY